VYVDGILSGSSISSGYFTVPTSGYHLLSYRFNNTPFPFGSIMYVPKEAIIAQFPSTVSSICTMSDKFPINLTSGKRLDPARFYISNNIVLIFKSDQPIAPSVASGLKLTKVHIPTGSTQSYLDFNYLSDTDTTKDPPATTVRPWRKHILSEGPLDLDKL
jgi:hypothetical protein